MDYHFTKYNFTDLLEEEPSDEVVLTYDGPAPREIVLTYEADLPPAMLEPAWWEEEPEDRPRPRRTRKGLVVLCIGVAVLAVTAAAVVFWQNRYLFPWFERDAGSWDDWEDYDDEGLPPGETTIASYPTGDDFRLSLTEDRTETLSPEEIYEKVNPSVVSVVAYSGESGSVGTGVIMSEDGYIVTNYHVIEGGSQCQVILSTGYYLPAKLVGYDADADLAVLKVEAQGLPAAEFGSSDVLKVGEPAYAIGNPLGLELRGTLTDGIISAINRDVDVDGRSMTLIQTNAALNSGNSGGPLINASGQVVGINTIKMVAGYEDAASVEGLGFAVPSSTVAHIVNCLIADGKVTPEPVLGVTVQAGAMTPDGRAGLTVKSVEPDLGGEAAGLQAGDIIVSADGEDTVDSSVLLRVRRRYRAGESLPVTYWRAGSYYETEIPLMIPEE